MEVNPAKRQDNVDLDIYRKKMKEIEFLQQFVDDPKIFDPDSEQFKTFLLQSFAYLHSDFHYLPFVNSKDIDQKLIKASEILQILPANCCKEKLFNKMSRTEISHYWARFFALFETKNDLSIDSIFSLNWENKIKFFKDVKSTFNYLNYSFSVYNLKNVDVDKEIEKWDENILLSDSDVNESTVCDFSMRQLNNMTTQKLIIDLKQIANMYGNLHSNYEKIKYDYFEFFSNFTTHAKDIITFKNKINVIDSSLLPNIYSVMLSRNEDNFLQSLYFLKKCKNLIHVLKLKINEIKHM